MLLMKLYLPAEKLLFRKLKKRSPAYTMHAGCRYDAAAYLKEKGFSRVLLVTDETIRRLGLADEVIRGLEDAGLAYEIFDAIYLNPTAAMCQKGREVGLRFGADCAIAIGGGAVLDCAKIICSGIAQPKTKIKRLCTILMPRRILPHIAIPTTAGTGAEISMGVVISDETTHAKRTGGSPLFTYDHVFLDAEVTVGLPPKSTAAFGYDALSHAVESYLSVIEDKEGHPYAIEAIRLIFSYLPKACRCGSDLEAREKMAYAAMRAGMAMNRNNAGLAHPFAHAIGGKYALSHGEMIAATLIPTLRFEADKCALKLAKLCVACGFGTEDEDRQQLASRMIDRLEELRGSLGLSGCVPALRREDFSDIIQAAFRDATFYPLPKGMNKKQARELLEQLLP